LQDILCGRGAKEKEHPMVRKQLARLGVASAAIAMVLGIAGATVVLPASSAGAATNNSTSNFQCACNPYLYLVETEIAGLPLVSNVSPELAPVFIALNTAVALVP
jgi:hypothetical protein